MAKQKNVSIYIAFLLRHKPEEIGLNMDKHGWVLVDQLIAGINRRGVHRINLEELKQIVANDNKGRYRFNEDGTKIKACQGHSIPWVEPELQYGMPPEFLYHGTTTEALQKIMKGGSIIKMTRHAVHLQAEVEKAWQSAFRWHKNPVVLKIAARKYHEKGGIFGETENHVWCTENVPKEYIVEQIYHRK